MRKAEKEGKNKGKKGEETEKNKSRRGKETHPKIRSPNSERWA